MNQVFFHVNNILWCQLHLSGNLQLFSLFEGDFSLCLDDCVNIAHTVDTVWMDNVYNELNIMFYLYLIELLVVLCDDEATTDV